MVDAPFKKLSEEIKVAIGEQLKKEEFQKAIKTIKESEDSGSFEVVISSADQDRQGEIIDQAGWDLEFYRLNPVVLWAHDYFSLPIGFTEKIEVKDGKLTASGKFAPESVNPFAQQVRHGYDLGYIRATSVGFITKEAEGNNIKSAELLEFSFVPVPANPFALSLAKAKEIGFDTEMLALKGIVFKQEEEPKEGDSCTLEDGTEGELKPNDEGELVCVPKTTEKPKPETEGDFIIIRVKDPDYFDPDSFRTIDISEEKGIKATIGCKKGEYEGGACNIGTEVQRYLFDKEKWTLAEAEAWVKENKSTKSDKKDVEKIGAELSALQSEIDDSIVRHSRTIIEIAQSENGTEEGKKQKIGRVLSEKNRTLIKNTVDQMKQMIAAFEELLQATEPQEGGEAGESRSEGTPKQRSQDAGSGNEPFDEWLTMRKVLRSANNATSEALAKINERLRTK